MLKKLLKFDLKNVFKFLSVFYILGILSAIITRIFLSINDSFICEIIGKICSGITISMIANILINNIMRVWVRFKNNLYGDESYLTHTLPVERKSLYQSKFLMSIVSMFVSSLAIILIIFIAYYDQMKFTFLKDILTNISKAYNMSVFEIIFDFLAIFSLEMICIVQAGYTGMILGHRKNSNKIIYSVIIGVLTYLASQIITLLFLFVAGIFDKNIMLLFTTNNLSSPSLITKIIYIAIVAYSSLLVIYYVFNKKIFNKGVNVE